MLRSYHSSLPMLLLAASCVPPAVAVQAPRAGVYELGAGETQPILLGGPALPPETALPRIDPAIIAPGAPAQPFSLGGGGQGDFDRSLQCLTTAVYHEARSESEDGQRAVAQVVLNRVRHPAFPNSVCGVVYQGRERRTGCQFSFTCDGSLARRIETSAWRRAEAVAVAALAGQVYEPVGLATHYHTTAIRPWWAPSLNRAITVGSHIFYRWKGEWGDPLAFRQTYAGEGQGETLGFAAVPGDGPQPVEIRRPGEVLMHRGTLAALDAGSAERGVRVHRVTMPAPVKADAEPTDLAEAKAEPATPPAEVPAAAAHGVNIHK